MSALNDYVEKVKQETVGFSELEIIRYVYLDLGKRFSFDLNYAFGNSKAKQQIYRESSNESTQENALEDNIIICKSLAYILEHIYEELGIHAETIIDMDDMRKCKHVYNIIEDQNGKRYKIDLQEDLENIQAYDRTKHFGISLWDEKTETISRKELEELDLKLGYIKKDFYYSGDYMYLMKQTVSYFDDVREKARFVLENLEPYSNNNRKYAERKWRHERLLKKVFNNDELSKIKLLDCYRQEEDSSRSYELYASVQYKSQADIYCFSEEEGYAFIGMEKFAKRLDDGLVCLDSVPGLKQYLKNRNNVNADGR